MRQLYIIIPLMLLIQSSISAKSSGTSQSTTGITIGGMFPHFNGNAGAAAGTITSRLLAKTYTKYNGGFIPVDSTVYLYYGTRGGATSVENPNNDESINFDESYTYLYNTSAGLYDNRLHRIQNFDANDKVQLLTYRVWKLTTGVWKDSARYVYKYSSNGQLISNTLQQWIQGIWTNSVPSTLTYDSKNNITQVSSVDYSLSFTYNSDNKLTSLTDKVWDNSSSTLVNNTRKSYSYNSGNISTYTLEKWNTQTNSWINTELWNYTYTGTDVETITIKQWDGSNWVNYSKHLFTYDNQGNKTSETSQIWNTSANNFINSKRTVLEFNNYNQPTLITDYTWDNSSAWVYALNDQQIRFYYGYYAPTVINPDPGNDIPNASIYPVPATDMVNIDINWDEPQAFNGIITDIKGTVVRRWSEPATRAYHKQENISDLPAGSYFVKLYGSKQEATQKLVVVR